MPRMVIKERKLTSQNHEISIGQRSQDLVDSPSTLVGYTGDAASTARRRGDFADPITTGPDDEAVPTAPGKKQRGIRFWMVFFALCIGQVVVSLEISSISTALRTIIHELQGGSMFIWIGSAYSLCSTAFVPLSGGLAEIFGRKPVLLGALVLVCIGSAICGAAPNMSVLIAGRAFQGLGGGGITALTAIIVADLVPLRDRGLFEGYLSLAWGVFTCIAPLIAGALAQGGQWRWLFYINIPFCALTAILVIVFLVVPPPPGTMREKLRRMDLFGNTILMGSSTAIVLAVTWAGVVYSWRSWKILLPLILGVTGLVTFFVYEAKLARYPVIPSDLVSTRTGFSGYLQCFLMNMVLITIIYYAPIYLQACKLASPIRSGVIVLSIALVFAAFSVVAGIFASKTGKYRVATWAAWALIVLGAGLSLSIGANSHLALFIVYIDLSCAGLGILISLNMLPILAPLSPAKNAPALSLATFARYFAEIWGIAIGGAILQNSLHTRLPASLPLPGSNSGNSTVSTDTSALELSVIPLIYSLPEPQRTVVRHAFADSLREIWMVVIGVAVLGLIASVAMKELQLHVHTDERWALEGRATPTTQTRAEEDIVAQGAETDEIELGGVSRASPGSSPQ